MLTYFYIPYILTYIQSSRVQQPTTPPVVQQPTNPPSGGGGGDWDEGYDTPDDPGEFDVHFKFE